MEPIIIAAIVAAIVSALGLLVQLQIARSSRLASREQLAIQSLTEIQRKAYSNLARLERGAESLRISSWELEGMIIDFMRNPDSEKPSIQRIISSFEQFGKLAHDFTGEWADVRPDVPSGIESCIRRQRHECLNNVTFLMTESHYRLSKDLAHESTDRFNPLLNLIRITRTQLDELAKMIKAVRENMIDPNITAR